MAGYSQSEEDYLEAFYKLKIKGKVIRVKNVAQALDVKMPSVVAAVRSLSEKGLVEQEKYGHIELTKKGEKVGKDVYDRHKLLYSFLREVLGLDHQTAEKDACQMEHCLSPQTRERLLRIIEFTHTCKDDKVRFLKRFMHFVDTGKMPDHCLGCTKC
ncbi:MAG: metal-dependent transcriptional regulator [Firmicutes bacterium]|jgi:DtxR family Mn-dependent transcriptional regulator|nr:metal-dependent transcriptional regulator [Bacillota bacterium]